MLFQSVSQKYLGLLDQSGVFDNTVSTAYPQIAVYQMIKKHLEEKSGKRKKVLIYGLDGARADSMFYLVQGNREKITGYNCKSPYSAVTYLK